MYYNLWVLVDINCDLSRHFDDFEKRIPRSEMEKLEQLAFETIESLDADFEAKVCGSYRRGELIDVCCSSVVCVFTLM